MAVSEALKGFLGDSRTKYTVMKHPVVYTAQEIAAAQHVPGRQLAKCVLVLTDRGPVLAVLPAIHLIDFKKLKAVLGAKSLSLAKEADIRSRFLDVEVGAMSPFGNLYQVPVVFDRALGACEEIVFNAGSHTETIKMRYGDLVQLVKPKLGAFLQPLAKPAKPKPRAKAKTARRSASGQRTRPRVKTTSRPRKQTNTRR